MGKHEKAWAQEMVQKAIAALQESLAALETALHPKGLKKVMLFLYEWGATGGLYPARL